MKAHPSRTLAALPVIVTLILLPALSQAWSAAGHRTVAIIAEHRLTLQTKEQVAAILGTNRTLAAVATWADDVRPFRAETAPWHYINLPVRETVTVTNLQDYCGTNDLLAAVGRCVQILKDGTATPSNRLESLKFIVHFIGDINTPLHCSDDGDRGGNEKFVRFFGSTGLRPLGRKTKLHALWDHLIRAEPGDDPARLARSLESRMTQEQEEAWAKGAPADWALDTYRVSKDAVYSRFQPGTTPEGTAVRLPRGYFSAMRPTVRTQLGKAGIRLAAVLNAAFDPAGSSSEAK